MGYSDATITSPAVGRRLLAKAADGGLVDFSAQPAQLHGSRTVLLRVAQNGRKVVYEIPPEEWSRLNRDATAHP